MTTTHTEAPMGMVIAVGAGDAGVTRDGAHVWSENDLPPDSDADAYWTVQKAEDAAAADPDHDWRIHKYGPMWEGEWQRQGLGKWVLIKTGMGFA